MHLKIISAPLDKIADYPGNPRTHTKDQIDQIVKSIEEFGWTNPVLIDENNRLIAGHGRTEAARKLGMIAVPAIRLEHLNETQKKALVVADNRLAEKAGWNDDLLALELSSLNDARFDVTITGFTMPEFDDIMASRIPGSLDDIDNAAEESEPEPEDQGEWEKIHLKVPPEVKQVFDDLMARSSGQKPYERFEAILGSVDVIALESLAKAERNR